MATDDRFQRTQGVLSVEAIERLAQTHVLVAGVGGSGGQTAVDLARLGVGYLTLADFDVYERVNMNRQVGCFESTLGEQKIDVVARLCSDINPGLKMKKVYEGVTDKNCHALISAADFPAPDFVMENIDLAGVQAKNSLHRACREKDVVIMTGLMVGFGGLLLVFDGAAPPYEKLFVDAEDRIDFSKIVPHLGSYVVKESFEACFSGRGTLPSSAIGATVASALQVSETVKGILLGKEEMTTWPEYLYVDLIDQVHIRGKFT